MCGWGIAVIEGSNVFRKIPPHSPFLKGGVLLALFCDLGFEIR